MVEKLVEAALSPWAVLNALVSPRPPQATETPATLVATHQAHPTFGCVGLLSNWSKAAETGEPWAIRELMDRIDGKVPQAKILQGDEEQPVRYAEVPRKAANADEWLQMQTPALASAEAEKKKLN
jgi:hypothetical protein